MSVPEFSPSEVEAGHVSLSELGKMFKMPTEEKTGLLDKMLYVGVPVIVITFAELLIFGGMLKEASLVYTILVLAFSFSAAVTKRQEIRKINQAFLLLPIFRLVNLAMPIFLKVNLYSLVFIYASLAMSAVIAATHHNIIFEKKNDTLRNIWIYLPVSFLAALIFAEAQYMFIGAEPLIPDFSPISLLQLTVIMIFVVALVEELIFRAILQTRLEEYVGAAGGIIASSLLFGIMHSGYGSFYAIGCAFLAGAFLGCSYYKTRDLPLVIVTNGLINVFLFGIIPYLGPGFGLM